MKQKLKKWFKTFGPIGLYYDIRGYREWINAINEEEQNKKSKYHAFGLKRNMFYNLYTQCSLKEEDSDLPEVVRQLRLHEILAPLHNYLDGELGFAGNITPEFVHFYTKEGEPTLSYGIIYRYSFDTISVNWIIKWAFILGVLFNIGHIKNFIIGLF